MNHTFSERELAAHRVAIMEADAVAKAMLRLPKPEDEDDILDMARVAILTLDDVRSWRSSRAPLTPTGSDLVATLRNLIDDVQEWCNAVAQDSSWDGWDDHYKSLANGNLSAYRAVLEYYLPREAIVDDANMPMARREPPMEQRD